MIEENQTAQATQEDASPLEALRRMVVYARQEAGHYTQTMVPYFLDMALQEIDEIMATRPERARGSM
ncbi:MAG: hypothetical protein KIS96_07005 [Bauldia sp.]|nr:hypothetical protein [Bauldia sp.]